MRNHAEVDLTMEICVCKIFIYNNWKLTDMFVKRRKIPRTIWKDFIELCSEFMLLNSILRFFTINFLGVNF